MSNTGEVDWDNSIYFQDYVVLAFSYLTTVIIGGITCIFVRNIYKNSRSNRTKDGTQNHSSADDKARIHAHSFNDERAYINQTRLITRASVIALVLYLAGSILISIGLTEWIIIIGEHGHIEMRIRLGLYVMPYAINACSFLSFIMLQLFNYYLQSRCVHITSFVFPCIAFALLLGVSFIGGNIAFANGNYSLGNFLRNVGSGLPLFVAIVVCIIIAILYLKQISQVMRSRLKVQMKRNNIEMADDVPQTSDESKVIVSLETVHDTVRCAHLVLVCATTNALSVLIAMIGNYTAKHPTHHNSFAFVGTLLDSTVNAMCIFSLFRFSESFYSRVCGCCHKRILKGYANRVVNGLMKKDNKLTRDQYIALIVEETPAT
eukprot:174702_1